MQINILTRAELSEKINKSKDNFKTIPPTEPAYLLFIQLSNIDQFKKVMKI